MAGESEAPLTWGAQLARAERLLAAAGLPAPRKEAAELLSHLLSVPVSELHSRPAGPMREADALTYRGWIARRAAGEAVAHITGHLEFMGLDITIGQRGPLPPPGAQQLVETALRWARRRTPGELLAAEIGTGCGAVALALAALEPRFTHIYALDSGVETLREAHANGARYLLNLVVGWLPGAGLDAIPEPVDLIVCGQPGWDEYALASEKLRPGGALICTVGEGRRQLVVEALASHFATEPVWVEVEVEGHAIVVAQRGRDQENC